MNIEILWVGKSIRHYNTVLWGVAKHLPKGAMWWSADHYVFWTKGKGVYFQKKKNNREFHSAWKRKKESYRELNDKELKDKILNDFSQHLLTEYFKYQITL